VGRPVLSAGWALVACLPLMGLAADPETKSNDKAFAALYNGKDLDGWEVKDGERDAWKAEGELLSCVGEKGGWLRTAKPFSDFVLKLEYRIPPGGNSGVGLRCPDEGNPAHAGMEVQILDDDAPEYKQLTAAQYNGGIYYQSAAKKGAAKPPGEWNAYEITCAGPHVKVVLNGQTIVDIQVDTFTKAEGDYKPLAERPETGFIGLQSHGARVDFRNLRIRDLTTTSKSGLVYADLTEGAGPTVTADATVVVHYTGRFLDGKKFDSSRDRDQPATFPLSMVIKGWTEGLTGMKVGGRRKLIVPPDLAYGERGAGNVIPPQATLVFDVEVVGIK
jgi:Domain of Unknown Function (DUF1080)/FKBP-type peptidyl-prolyl cis-trans isomerase